MFLGALVPSVPKESFLRQMIDITKLTLSEVLDLKRQLQEAGLLKVSTTVVGQTLRHNYAEWDWTKRNTDLAREHSVSIQTVSNWRGKLGSEKSTKHFPACKNWDWSKSDTAIAREHKINVGSVQYYRVKLGKPTAPRDYEKQPEVIAQPIQARKAVEVYEGLDWSKPDVVLSREIGVTREYVRQVRARLGKPKALHCDVKFRQFTEAVNGKTSLNYKEAQTLHPGISLVTFGSYCSRLGITRTRIPKAQKYQWEKLNWSLPNKLLSDIWGISNQLISSYRCNFNKGKPAFRVMDGPSKKAKVPEQFLAAVELERQKASDHRDPNSANHSSHSQPEADALGCGNGVEHGG